MLEPLPHSLDQPRPGKPLLEWQLFRPRVKVVEGDLVETGMTTPEGKYFPFKNGEKSVFVGEEANRKVFIRLVDGRQVPFVAWQSSQRPEVVEVLEKANPKYAALYLAVVAEYPEMAELQIKGGTPKDFPVLEETGGFWLRPEGDNPNPMVVVETSQTTSHYQKLLTMREFSARDMASKLGIDFEMVKQHPEILALFILGHEIGHAQDYLTNYVLKAVDERGKAEAYQRNRIERQKQMATLPVPGRNIATVKKLFTSGKLNDVYEARSSYYQSLGIMSAQELVLKQEVAYRLLPSEAYADNFAAKVLIKHWQELGLPPKGVSQSPTA